MNRVFWRPFVNHHRAPFYFILFVGIIVAEQNERVTMKASTVQYLNINAMLTQQDLEGREPK